ncbi:MAG: hypothetical protein KAJ18_07250 [Candidatus Omnitrophica bacterium]|nr:hypothetical protein [Candidatus Omnitrophota bacterium]
MDKFKKFKIVWLIVFAVGCLFVPCEYLSAEENALGLSKQNDYNIYITGEDGSLSVIRGVEVVGFRTIEDVKFLVVRTDTFDAKRTEGLILFDYIRVILPSHKTLQIQPVR